MIKKNTYLVRVISSENEPRLEEISGKEWKQIVSANKNLPKEQKRYFREGPNLDYITVMTELLSFCALCHIF